MVISNMNETETLSVNQIAKELGIANATVSHWCETGELVATNSAKNVEGRYKIWRVRRSDLEVFLRQRSNQSTQRTKPKQAKSSVPKPTKDFLKN